MENISPFRIKKSSSKNWVHPFFRNKINNLIYVSIFMLYLSIIVVTGKYLLDNIKKLKENNSYNQDQKKIFKNLYKMNGILLLILIIPLLILYVYIVSTSSFYHYHYNYGLI